MLSEERDKNVRIIIAFIIGNVQTLTDVEVKSMTFSCWHTELYDVHGCGELTSANSQTPTQLLFHYSLPREG